MAPKMSLISEFPCFNLEWPASFFGLFLLSVYRGQFVNQQGSEDSHGGGWGRGQANLCLIPANQRRARDQRGCFLHSALEGRGPAGWARDKGKTLCPHCSESHMRVA